MSKCAWALFRVAAKQGSTTSKSQKPTAKRKAAHESRSTPEAPAKRFVTIDDMTKADCILVNYYVN